MTAPASLSLAQTIDQFTAAMRAAGLVFDESIYADGTLHRVTLEGDKRGSLNGWYVLHADGIPAGQFGSWKSGLSETWRADIGRELSEQEAAAQRARIEAMRAARKAEQAKLHEEARSKAAAHWLKAGQHPQADHPYLRAKGVRAYGIRQMRSSLLVPLRDADGTLHGVQWIKPDGSKTFGTGTAKAAHFHLIEALDGAADTVLLICEGYATGASLHAATGHMVAVAFDAGNLLSVAKALRKRHPQMRIVIAADNDHATAGNPGLTKARAAAQAIAAQVIAPEFAPGDAGTDFNDVMQARGLDAVRAAFSALDSAPDAAPGDATPFATGAGGHSGNDDPPFDAADDAPLPEPPPAGRAFPVARFELRTDGVYWCDVEHRGGKVHESAPLSICSPLRIEAVTRDTRGRGFGRLLAFKDADGNEKTWIMPARLLAGSKGDELRGALLDAGLPVINTEARAQRKLIDYLMTQAPPARARCVSQVGWHNGVYVLPDQTYGSADSERYYLSDESGAADVYERGGTLRDWIDTVAKPACDHSRLLFALGCAFAGPLLEGIGGESGGFHLVGGSSGGKTTALRVAASVWGHGERFWRPWRSSDNGLEAIAADHCDGLLGLDEIREADPKTLGEMAYLLGNGRGKQRANRNGSARAVKRWRCVVLSTGEAGTATLLNAAGQRSYAGHDVRLVEIPAFTGRGQGIFDTAKTQDEGRTLAEDFKRDCTRDYGHAGPAFLRLLCSKTEDHLRVALNDMRGFIFRVVPNNADAQVLRVAGRIGVIEAAAKLAARFWLLPTEGEDIEHACADVFQAWLHKRGTAGALEPLAMVRQVRAFIEANGAAQFQDLDKQGGEERETFVINSAGFKKTLHFNGHVHYLVYPERFKRDVCAGLDHVEVCKALAARNILRRDEKQDRYTYKLRVPGKEKPIGLYALDADTLFADED